MLAGDLPGSAGLPAPPVIVRLAGLSAHTLEPFSSPLSCALLRTRASLAEELQRAREALVETIGQAIPGLEATARRFLLSVRRDCFNNRDISKYRRKPGWAELLRVAPDLTEQITTLEEQAREKDQILASTYEREIARERRHLLQLAQKHSFLRGVALGAPGLVQKVRSSVPSTATSGDHGPLAKWELSLLRYVTRAAVKLSANSTLTAYALGSIQPFESPAAFRLAGTPRREVSLVRADRPELEQFQALLMRHPSVRKRSLVAWNDSVEEIEPGQFRLIREGYWDLAPDATKCHFVRPARVNVEFSNSYLEPARLILGRGTYPYDELLDLLENGAISSVDEARAGRVRSALDQLIDFGFLILLPPWPAYEVRLEQRIERFLKALPEEPSLDAILGALANLVVLEDSFASCAEPENTVLQLENALSRLLGTVAPLAGHNGPISARAQFFEDVLVLTSDDEHSHGRILQIAPAMVESILHSADLVSRFAGLFNLRHDVMHTLAAWWRSHEPNRREIPFTEIARGFAPLWKQFIQFHRTANQSALNTFDPLQAPALEELQQQRKALLSRYQDLLKTSPTPDQLLPHQTEELLATLPRRYFPLLGSCAFVQPVDASGSSWVLNHLHEGTGRYLSRVTPILAGSLRQRFLDHLTSRSTVDVEDGEADLLEVMNPWGNLVNAHPPQAKRVLEVRGVYLGLPRERRVRFDELKVQADLDSDFFRLVDASGRQLLPVNLSTLASVWHPNLLRFLLAFGPGETRGIYPSAYSEGDEHLRVFSRLTCGRLVLRRRRWEMATQSLRETIEQLDDYRAYVHLYDWRQRLGLPVEGFYYEGTYHGMIKPQYVNFESPSLCSVFISSLRRRAETHLIFEEALPSPRDFPSDPIMGRRGLELLIDSLAARTARESS